ncbi:UNVERIFIED_CONTAM: Serine/threonine-protein kinaseA [Sesamum angustifolium]|uniref:Serine/threonine-protein kinaseA n=1 Tax=Sesamum angustifolium TaxID=2727405 RepID=A0AAW2IQT3_9LAMI
MSAGDNKFVAFAISLLTGSGTVYDFIEPAPMLEDKEKWSLVFHDFVAKCLTKDPRLRPTAAEMLKHKFIEKCRSGASTMVPKIEKAKQIRASMASQTQDIAPDATLPREGPLGGPISNEGIVGSVPSRPQDGVLPVVTQDNQAPPDGVQTAIGGDFGTVIVHEKVEIGGTATPTSTRAEESFSATTRLGSISVSRLGDNALESWLDSPASARTVAAGLQSPHANLHGISIPKLLSIYSAGNTVPIPFLRATDISPIALLSDNVLGGWQQDNGGNIAVDAMQELFSGDAQPKKGRSRQNEVPLPPSVCQRLSSSPTLMNLAQALAYHKMCYEEMPLQEMQAAQEQQTIQNLSDTLRTILRL